MIENSERCRETCAGKKNGNMHSEFSLFFFFFCNNTHSNVTRLRDVSQIRIRDLRISPISSIDTYRQNCKDTIDARSLTISPRHQKRGRKDDALTSAR